jgi:hypothetical protein
VIWIGIGTSGLLSQTGASYPKPTLEPDGVVKPSALAGIRAEEPTLSERVLHYRAIDAVVWAMPLLNFKTFRDGHKAIGAGYNDIERVD